MHADESHRAKAEAAGAVGFLSKSAPLPTLAAAVRAAAAGEVFVDTVGGTAVLDDYQDAVLDPGAAALTARERELLGSALEGHLLDRRSGRSALHLPEDGEEPPRQHLRETRHQRSSPGGGGSDSAGDQVSGPVNGLR